MIIKFLNALQKHIKEVQNNICKIKKDTELSGDKIIAYDVLIKSLNKDLLAKEWFANNFENIKFDDIEELYSSVEDEYKKVCEKRAAISLLKEYMDYGEIL